ncbi:mitochondrial proton/calcium exchanger protein [Agrilus planipennis]|uniref:Mitochondrial proton/calcium exchanger protein n=1 Tax=Agrilus planipennis TaxID=224129 RepID=A0A1W4X5U9_AGRPL|nr:mitochondrial proton/calcium exchanger protein [Agrilus planipennis]
MVQFRYVLNSRQLVRSCRSSTEIINHLNTSNYHSKFATTLTGGIIPSNNSNNKRCTSISPLYYDGHYFSFSLVRNFSTSLTCLDKDPLKPSSKVEVIVQEIKKKKEEEITAPAVPEIKKSITQKIKDEIIHYYHGFRLLFIDIKISSKLVWRILSGKPLSRREHRLLMRTVGDIFRLVPFSVFIIVPFMELLLPVFIKFFPGMLPSTFESASDKEAKIKQNLKIKIEMAKFLQETLDDMALLHTEHNSALAKEFKEWFNKVRTSGAEVTNEEIMKFSTLFQDEDTLDCLTRSQLVALCRVLEVQTLGTTNMLRFQLQMKLRRLAADDKMIQKEGIESLTLAEVQQACRARGMRSYGLSENRLRKQLAQWLDLSLNKKVPASLLLFSRALMLPETIPTEDQLKATISALPESLVTQTQANIGEKEGKIDNKIKIQILKEEERRIKEERKEERRAKQLEKKETLVDKAPVISAEATPPLKDTAKVVATEKKLPEVKKKKIDEFDVEDLEVMKRALESVSDEKKFLLEKGKLEAMKEEMEDYQEDVQDFNKVIADQPKPKIKESKAARRLFNRVNKMINKMDVLMEQLQNKEQELKKDLNFQLEKKEKLTDAEQKKELLEPIEKKKEELLKIDDLLAAIRKVKEAPDESRVNLTKRLLQTMDDDKDGSVKVEDLLKVLEIVGKEDIKLTAKQWEELIELIEKEEVLEVEKKIEKALQKEKEEKETPTTEQPLQIALNKENKLKVPGSKSSESSSKSKPEGPSTKLETKANVPPPPSLENTQSKNKKVF